MLTPEGMPRNAAARPSRIGQAISGQSFLQVTLSSMRSWLQMSIDFGVTSRAEGPAPHEFDVTQAGSHRGILESAEGSQVDGGSADVQGLQAVQTPTQAGNLVLRQQHPSGQEQGTQAP